MAIGKYIKAIGENLIRIVEEMETEAETETSGTPSGVSKPSKSVNATVSGIIAENESGKGSDEKTPSKIPSKADVRKLLAKKSVLLLKRCELFHMFGYRRSRHISW